MGKGKGIAGLIRLRQWRVDELRKRMGALLSERGAVEQAQAELERCVIAEQEAIRRCAATPEDAEAIESGSFAYGPFAQRVIAERETFARELARFDGEIDALQEEMREAFLDLKQVEIVDERAQARAAAEALKRELAAYDEAALRGFSAKR